MYYSLHIFLNFTERAMPPPQAVPPTLSLPLFKNSKSAADHDDEPEP